MKEVCQQLRPIDDSGPRAREIRARVYGVNTARSDRRQIERRRIGEEVVRLIRGLVQMEAARHDDYDLGSPTNNVVPRDAYGIGALTAELVHATGKPDHFRDPVT